MRTDHPDTTTSHAERARRHQRDRDHVWHPWSPLHADRSELTIARGDGYRVWDDDGNEYLDALSLNTTCGYRHPWVMEAVARQMDRLHQFDLSRASHEPAGELAQRLAGMLPAGLERTLFVNSGSEAFEAAVLIASQHWSHVCDPRSRVVSFALGYQGATLMARSLSRLPRVGHPFHAPFAVTAVEMPLPPSRLREVTACERLLERFAWAIGEDPADRPLAVVVEPFLNVGGGVVLPPGFLRALAELCRERDTLLVLDEVFTAFGRTGSVFALDHEGVVPDILVTSKGLAGGYMPIGAVTVEERVHRSFDRDPVLGGVRYGHTTSGHPVACAAALATLDVIESEGLARWAAQAGRELLGHLAPLAACPDVVDVRGFGLLVVVETSTPEVADRMADRARRAGLLLRRPGAGEVLMAAPPLTIDREGIDLLAERLSHAVTSR